jgi:Photosynthesis system II assembly factor YCF48
LEAPHKDSDAFDSILTSKLINAPFGTAHDCPDASILAAFYDATLAPLDRARMQGHIDACARCQAALAAIARAADDADRALAPKPAFEWRRRLSFGLPAAAAAAIALVIVVRARNVAQPPSNELALNSAPAQAVQALAPQAMAPAPGAGAAEPDALQHQALARAESANGGAAAFSNSPMPPAPPPAAPPASAGASSRSAMSAAALGGFVRRQEFAAANAPMGAAASSFVVAQEATPTMQDTAHRPPNTSFTVESPDSLATWVIGPGGSIVKRTHSGRTFTQTSGVNVELLAASAPSPKDCWIVGRKGTVLRTRDGGRYWENVLSPTTADIVHVRAADAHNAVIRTAEGKSYATTDGGATWNLQ